MSKREISIGTVKVSRNQKRGSFIEVKSKAVEQFFILESKRGSENGEIRIEPGHSVEREGFAEVYLLNNVSTIEGAAGCSLRPSVSPVEAGYCFLRAKGLSEGLRVPLNIPQTSEGAQKMGERIGRCMQALYISYMRNYSFEITVKANVETVDYERLV